MPINIELVCESVEITATFDSNVTVKISGVDARDVVDAVDLEDLLDYLPRDAIKEILFLQEQDD